jgi:hypothetical protein
MRPEHGQLLRHALGADSRSPGYRNYFAATPGSEDDSMWAELVALGLAVVLREPSEGLFPLRCYAASKAGKAFVLPTDEAAP